MSEADTLPEGLSATLAGIGITTPAVPAGLNGTAPAEYVLGRIVAENDLTQGQKAALALWLLPEYDEGVERKGRPGLATSKLGSRYPVHTPETEHAAEVLGIGKSALFTTLRIQKRRPEVLSGLLSGGMNISQAARLVGLARGVHTKKGLRSEVIGIDAGGRTQVVQYGRGDKWAEAISPLMRYLMAWEKKSFKFSHINPKEARKRLQMLEAIQHKLEQVKQDLEPRAVSATLRVPDHNKKERKR